MCIPVDNFTFVYIEYLYMHLLQMVTKMTFVSLFVCQYLHQSVYLLIVFIIY